MLTQPLMYKKIGQHPGTRRLYADKLAAQGLGDTLGDDMAQAYRTALDEGRHTIDPVVGGFKRHFSANWEQFLDKPWTDKAATAIPPAEWKRLAERITQVPDDFNVHPLARKVLDDRAAMGRGEIQVDWGMGEHMAFATLLAEGFPIRISGQDCGRGTFTHRHAVLHDQKRERFDEGIYIPLQNIEPDQPAFTVIDSILSEEAVLGFEYGYASNAPRSLVVWEAQFGDFANGVLGILNDVGDLVPEHVLDHGNGALFGKRYRNGAGTVAGNAHNSGNIAAGYSVFFHIGLAGARRNARHG